MSQEEKDFEFLRREDIRYILIDELKPIENVDQYLDQIEELLWIGDKSKLMTYLELIEKDENKRERAASRLLAIIMDIDKTRLL